MTILIKTDGYEINTEEYTTSTDAKTEMLKEYEEILKNENIDKSSLEMSSCNETDAILYTGNDVFVWKVYTSNRNTEKNA